MSTKLQCFCLVALVCLLSYAYIAYITFSIIYLINDKSIADNCNNSNLWLYNLISLILTFISRMCSVKNGSDQHQYIMRKIIIITYIWNIFIELGLSIWGGIELFNNCDELKDSNLWDLGLANFIMQIFVVVLILWIFILSICNENDIKKNKIIMPHIPEITIVK
tara:strand:+ start:1277 stop:1771 length:495 start_codon:yes stop_codon:yes gene_type:complete